MSESEIRRFANTELYFRAKESVRGADCFIVQTHYEPVNEAIMEQLIMIDAMKRASAKRITAVIPYYGYSRQDHKALSREPISAKLVADMLTVAGADRIISVDLHSGQIQGYFDAPFDHLTALPILSDYLENTLGLHGDDLVVVAPDAGRIKTAEVLRKYLHADLAFLYKRRSKTEAHKIEEMAVVGEVDGRPCVLVDDMIDTAGTVAHGAAGAAGARGRPDLRGGDARDLLGQGASVTRGVADPGGRGHEHRADPRRAAVRQADGAVDRPTDRDGAPRGVRRQFGQRDLPRRQPDLGHYGQRTSPDGCPSSNSVPWPAPGTSMIHRRASPASPVEAGIHRPSHVPSDDTETRPTDVSVRTRMSASKPSASSGRTTGSSR